MMLLEHSVVKEIKQNCLRNLCISLYWEEKVLMVFRFSQFYGFLLIALYETFPYPVRSQWAYYLFATTGTIHFAWGPD